MALRRASRIHPLWQATHLMFNYEIGSGPTLAHDLD